MNYLEEYRQHQCLCLKGWMPDIEVARYVAQIDALEWCTDRVTSDNFRFDVVDAPALTTALNARVFELAPLVSTLLDGVSLSYFEGTLKRLQEGPNYRFPWHSDKSGGRVMGVSLCFAAGEGGDFEMRLKWSKDVHACLKNLNPGDIHLFDVADVSVVHRVTPVMGPNPRIFFAGWFYV